jgi:hypothetical protein
MSKSYSAHLASPPSERQAVSSAPLSLLELKKTIVDYSDHPAAPIAKQTDSCCSITYGLWSCLLKHAIFFGRDDCKCSDDTYDEKEECFYGAMVHMLCFCCIPITAVAAVGSIGTICVTGPRDTVSFFKTQHANCVEQREKQTQQEIIRELSADMSLASPPVGPRAT